MGTTFSYMLMSGVILAVVVPVKEMIDNVIWGLRQGYGFTPNVLDEWGSLLSMAVTGFILGLFIVPTALYIALIATELVTFLIKPLPRR